MIAKMNSACMMFRRNKGYTFTEVVLSLTILTIVTAFISPVFPLIKGMSSYTEEFAAEQFTHVLYEEVSQSKTYTFTRDVLVVTDKDDRTIEISQNGSTIKRTVNGKGYEILLENVKNLSYTEKDFIVSVEVGLTNEETFEEVVHLPHKK